MPSYLLIQGGGATARFWDRLLPHLDHPALAVDLPGRNGKAADLATLTVEDEVASVLADVDAAEIDDPVVIVAHSSGGLVVPGVDCSRVRAHPRVDLTPVLASPGDRYGRRVTPKHPR